MSQKLALIIGNSEYEDTTLVRLIAPDTDVEGLTRVLSAPDIGSFDEVTTLINESVDTVRRAIARLFAGKRRGDLLLLYFSGHGIRDDQGDLYLSVKDTERKFPSATAIPAAFITGEMDRSRSRRQVLILDCCHSGAFARGAKGAPGASVSTATVFEGTGYGRVVLTATDSTQYAWEGDQVIGEAENSVFTHYLIQGLRTGEADANADGRITLDELYDYVYEHVVTETSKQTPGKWAYKQQGEIVIARNPRPVVKPSALPLELRQAIENPYAGIREGAVRELDYLLRGSHMGLALAAHAALTRLMDDDSRRVSEAAAKSLVAYSETHRVENTEVERKEEARKQKQLKQLYAQAEQAGAISNWSQAIDLLQRVLEIDQDYGDTSQKLVEAEKQKQLAELYSRGVARFRAEEWVEARQLFQQILGIDANYKDVSQKLADAEKQKQLAEIYSRGVAHFRTKEWAKASNLFQQILKTDRDYKDSSQKLAEARKQEQLAKLYSQGMAHFRAEEWVKARDLFQQILKTDKDYKDSSQKLAEVRKQEQLARLYSQGMAHFRAEEWVKANNLFQQILEIGKDYKDTARKLVYTKQAIAKQSAFEEAKVIRAPARMTAAVKPQPRPASKSLVLMVVGIVATVIVVGLTWAAASISVLIIGVAAIALGYGLYARTIDANVIWPDSNRTTPAKMYMDGVDFAPASRNVLLGYQFKSIAALAPITGPIIAVQWGWLPALVWIILGTSFIGWVQDYGAMIMSVRREGDTMGALSYKLISPRARTILMIFIYFYLLMVMGAFGNAVGKALLINPKVPFGMISVVVTGVLAGQMIYKWKQDIIVTTIVTVVVAFLGIWLGTTPAVSGIFESIYGPADRVLFLGNTQAQVIGTLLMVIFCYLGAVLPIWSFAQPINYVSFWIVSLGMVGGVIGLLIWRPGMGDFPAFTSFTTASGPLWPMLFVTIACGAISGWHSLVSTSGTARQLEKETDALPVGGGAMFIEMVFSIIAFLTATVAFGSWQGYQDAGGAGGSLVVFAGGLATFLNRIGVPETFGVPYGSVFLAIMALTIMQLAVRFMRVASAELLGYQIPAMKNVHMGTIAALLLTLLFVWIIPWLAIWGAFGASNQLMAGLALLLIALWLKSEGRKNTWVLYPFIFMIVTAVAALIYLAYKNLFEKLPYASSQTFIACALVGTIALVLVVAAVILIVDGVKALRAPRKKEAVAAARSFKRR